MAREAFWTDAASTNSDGTFNVNKSMENEPGYLIHKMGFLTQAAAKDYADAMNRANGLSREEAMEIKMSSMAASREEENRKIAAKLSGFTEMVVRAMAEHYATEPGTVIQDLEEAGVMDDLGSIGAQLESFGY